MPDGPPPTDSRSRRRAAVHVLAATLILANVTVIASPASEHYGAEPGLLRSVDELFLLGQMFAGAMPSNVEVFFEGRRDGRWHPLDTRGFLESDVPGVQVTRVFALRHERMGRRDAQQAAWRALAERVRARQNRLHPEAPVDAVRFGARSWAKDRAGYRAGQAEGTNVVEWFTQAHSQRAPRAPRAAPDSAPSTPQAPP